MPDHALSGSRPVDTLPGLTQDLPCHDGLVRQSLDCGLPWFVLPDLILMLT